MESMIQHDNDGVPRFLTFPVGESTDDLGTLSPLAQAGQLLLRNARALALKPETLKSLDAPLATLPEDELEGLRVEVEKHIMDSVVVGYVQTYFGLPVIDAGVRLVLADGPRPLRSIASTVHHDIKVQKPSTAAIKRAKPMLARRPDSGLTLDDLGLQPPNDGLNDTQRAMQINSVRMVVFHFDAARRHGEPQETPPADQPIGLQEPQLPSMPLPELPPSIKDGAFYVALEVFFVASGPWGRLNWVAYIDVDTDAILQLKPLVDHVGGAVFLRDPITKGSGLAASATNAQLNPLRDAVTLPGLGPASSGSQALTGEFVNVVDAVLPTSAPPTTTSPFNFSYNARTDNFGATNTYYQCDRFFRMVRDMGFTIATYFDGTTFPVTADHRGFGGNVVNARCPGNAVGNGIGTLEFALADTTDTTNPMSIAADWRVVLHELGGHGILWDHVNSPNFGFAHSAGDSFGAILNDPASGAPDRFVSFPWVNIGRRHDRAVSAGWGWAGSNDIGGYSSEQVLSTTLFRMYRSIGGDSSSVPRREFAARTAAYLILRAVATLTPATNPGGDLGRRNLEIALETADAGTWTSTDPAETHAGGAYWKVIRWSFEKQGLYRAAGAATTTEGAPPDVDVYINDGRNGEYIFQPNHWSCTDIWNRRTIGDGGGVHEEPVVNQTNYAYVRIKNRGTQAATNVTVKGFHCLPGIGLVYPDDWAPMTTAQLSGPNLSANDSTGVVIGPFQWTPSEVGHECMFFSVSATGDASNIDGRITGSIPEWRLVPHDNNIGQRNVHPVAIALGPDDVRSRSFWLRNPFDHAAKVQLAGALPKFLQERGWKLDFISSGRDTFGMKAGGVKEIQFMLARGGEFDRRNLPDRPEDRAIDITAEVDGIPLGGMRYVIDPDYVDPNKNNSPVIHPHGGGRGEPERGGDPCVGNASELLKCLHIERAEIEDVEVRRISLDITFKRSCD